MPVKKTDRESIIKQSIHLFKIHGYYNTTMANIGEACGLIKGSIYHHFKSKEELAYECMRYIHEFFNKDIFAIADTDKSPKEKLGLFTRRVEKYFLNSEGGCLLGNFALEVANNIPSLKQAIISYFTDWETALCQILTPELGRKLAKEKAIQIVASTQGSIMLMRIHGNSGAFKIQNKETIHLLD